MGDKIILAYLGLTVVGTGLAIAGSVADLTKLKIQERKEKKLKNKNFVAADFEIVSVE